MADFAFSQANGTTLEAIDSKWAGDSGEMVTGSGYLVSSAGRVWYENAARFEDGQGADQSVGAIITWNGNGYARLYLHQNGGQAGYGIEANGTNVSISRNGSYGNQAAHGGTPTAAPFELEAEILGGEVFAFYNGVAIVSYDDPSPLSGGYPGLGIYGAGSQSNAAFDSWTDGEGAASGPVLTADQQDGADNQSAVIVAQLGLSATQPDGADVQGAVAAVALALIASQSDGADAQASTVTATLALQADQQDDADSQTATIAAAGLIADQVDNPDAQASTVAAVVLADAAQQDGADAQASTVGGLVLIDATQTEAPDSQLAEVSAAGPGIVADQADGPDVQTASAVVRVVAGAAQTEDDDTQVATVGLGINAGLSITELADSMTAEAALVVLAGLDAIELPDTLLATLVHGDLIEYARAPAGPGYVPSIQTITRPGTRATARPATTDTRRP